MPFFPLLHCPVRRDNFQLATRLHWRCYTIVQSQRHLWRMKPEGLGPRGRRSRWTFWLRERVGEFDLGRKLSACSVWIHSSVWLPQSRHQ